MSVVADVLRAAADRLERTGKCEGRFYGYERDAVGDENCRACAEGAVAVAAKTLDRHMSAMQALRRHLDATSSGVYLWSDSHSLPEVVAGLRAAADGAE